MVNIKDKRLMPSLNLGAQDTILNAFKAINGNFGMVVTVVKDGAYLCGIVSEGDLRRALLSGKSLHAALGKVMNVHPITINLEDLGDEAKCESVIEEIYCRYGTGQGQQATIPVVNKDSCVVGLAIPEMLRFKGRHNGEGVHRKSGCPQVLVVGGAGYIGSVLVRMLIAEGWRVRVLDNMLYMQTSLDEIKNSNLSVIRGDVTNINDIVESIEEIDAVVYLAEIVGDSACIYRPERALKTNYLAVVNMTNLCSYLNINRFIYTSSCSVYGGSRDPENYLTEESEINPVSHYARMKMMVEQALLGISNPLFAPTILRIATVFGYSYRPRFDLVVNAFAKNAFFNRSIEVFGGNQSRPNVHTSDVARAIIKTLEVPIEKVSRQIFNVGGIRENYTINELAEFTLQVFPGVKIKQNKNTSDPRNYKVDFSKIEKTLGFHTQFSVMDGLRELRYVFEKGTIKNPDDLRHSNLEALREFCAD